MAVLLAFAAGTAAANLYYNQPMLGLMAGELGIGGNIGLITTFTQLGYTGGMLLLVPLGDRLDRKRMILAECFVLVLAAAASAISPNFAWLAIASVVVGVNATIAQLIIPLAADLASPAKRGQAVGTVFSGVLAGILLARTLSGAVGQTFGWRAMYWCAAAVALGLGVLLSFKLPRVKPRSSLPYQELLRSMGKLLARHASLRRACGVQACLFAGFSAFWSILALLLEGPDYGMGAAVAGAFGIIGLVGIGIASWGGRLADRYGPRTGTGVGIVSSGIAFLIFAGVPSIAGLVAGVIFLDLGIALAQVSNQSMILGLDEDARSRINTIYVTAIFSGGTLGSAMASFAWQWAGWMAVSLLGLTLAAIALIIHIGGRQEARA